VPDPIDKASNRLSRFTTYCPMTISGTTILNMAAIMPLYNIMLKEELTEENLV
jgi:Cell cycle and development regulator